MFEIIGDLSMKCDSGRGIHGDKGIATIGVAKVTDCVINRNPAHLNQINVARQLMNVLGLGDDRE